MLLYNVKDVIDGTRGQVPVWQSDHEQVAVTVRLRYVCAAGVGRVRGMSTHASWRLVVIERLWPAARSLGMRAAQGLWSATIRWVAAPLAAQLRRTVARPLTIAGAALLGMAYGATVSTLLGTLLALALGLVRRWPPTSEIHDVVIIGVGVLLPTIGWTVGYIALGVGAIVGASCAASGGGLWAGLEWAAVGGLGTALGLGVAYGSWHLMALGLAWGAILGGSVGLASWLCCTDRETMPVERRTLVPYAAALALIALYVPLALDWVIGTLGG